MTKQDFQLIAQTIADLPCYVRTGMNGEPSSRQDIAEHFASALATTNPRFKRDLFIQAATGVVPVTARKAKDTFCRTCGGDCAGTGFHPTGGR